MRIRIGSLYTSGHDVVKILAFRMCKSFSKDESEAEVELIFLGAGKYYNRGSTWLNEDELIRGVFKLKQLSKNKLREVLFKRIRDEERDTISDEKIWKFVNREIP